MKVLLLVLFCLVSLSCSTLERGPLILGNVPMPLGKMQEGRVYKDSKGRFTVPCPAPRSAISKNEYGVTFLFMDGIQTYMVAAYDKPYKHEKNVLTISSALADIKESLGTWRYNIRVFDETRTTYRGFESLDFNFIMFQPAQRVYVTRFVKAGNLVYWLAYSMAGDAFEDRHMINAERFFDNITFQDRAL